MTRPAAGRAGGPVLVAVQDGRDPLTGALGRDRLHEEVARVVAAADRHGDPAAVCVLDLDHLRLVNEVHGHGAGDRLLAASAAAIAERLRATDELGRVGADEFAVVLARTGAEEARAMAAELLAAVRSRARVVAGAEDVRVTASVGVALVEPGRPATPAEVLAAAEGAMLAAKRGGRDRYAVADRSAGGAGRARERLSWAGRIRDALETGGLDLHAQPIVALDPGARHPPRHELLVRLRDDGDVAPGDFLGTAERFGQIQAIDGWVVARALDLIARVPDVVLHVNLSPASIGDAELVTWLERAVRAAGGAGGRLVLELTETAAVADVPAVRAALDRLGAVGCRAALDDFGAGFASFAYLKQLPFDLLKVDGQFVRDLPGSRVDQLAVAAMATVARGLGMETVAEYVGDDGTLDLLRELGVDHAQGFHVGAPRPVAELWA